MADVEVALTQKEVKENQAKAAIVAEKNQMEKKAEVAAELQRSDAILKQSQELLAAAKVKKEEEDAKSLETSSINAAAESEVKKAEAAMTEAKRIVEGFYG